jgi:hypothetical protein
MAIPFLNNINLNNNEIQNVRLQNAGSPPLNSGPGQIYFDSTQSPSIIDTAKYYANSTDTWVSLKEYSFPTGNYVTGAVTGTTPKPIITFDLNAIDGTAAETSVGNGIRYLSKNNKWAEIASIPGTYKFTISDNASPTPVTGIVAEDDTVQIAANTDLTSNLTGQATTTKTLTIGLKVDSGLGNANNYVLNQGTEVATADDTIPFNDYTPGATPPSTQTNIVKKTTFGTIPVTALTEVKTYIDNAVAGGLIYQGGYDATLNSPDLTTSPNSILKGWTYTVTVGGTFFGEVLEVGDVLIAEQDDPSSLADWTTVQNNIGIATDGTDTGAGAAIIGISRYDEDDFTVSATGFVQLNATSATGTITAGSTSGTVIHNFGTTNVIVQTYLDNATDNYPTVFCDITRTTTEVTATIAATETDNIIILVQKIG